jgi:hypothetical protein
MASKDESTHTIRCECGRTFLDANAHRNHKMKLGKKGHRSEAMEREAEPCGQWKENANG